MQTNVLIITVTPTESKAVLNVFKEATGHTSKTITIEDRTYRDLGVINDSKVFMAISEMGANGLGAAQQTVQKAIQALNPHAVIMVGIAFGVNESKQSIGEILVSKQLMLYESQRIGNGEIVLRGDRPHCSASLLNYLNNAHLDWTDSDVNFGLILTGEKLIDNLDYRDALRKLESEAIGGEMEGAGLYVSCQDAKVDWILVKAICDWADGNKHQDKKNRQKLAAENAAAFVLHALQHAELPTLKVKNSDLETPAVSCTVNDSTVNGSVVTANQISNSFNTTHYHDSKKKLCEELSDDWFKSHIETSIADLGHRYTQELNVELYIAKNFDAISRNERFYGNLRNEVHQFLKEFKRVDSYFLNKIEVKEFINLLVNQVDGFEKSELLNIDIESIDIKWTPLSRQFIIEFKRVLSLLQLTGAVPILLNKLLLLRRRHVDIPSCVLRRNVVKG